jgi:hypothetical protein
MSEQELDELDHAVAEALGGVLDGDGWRFDPPLTIYGPEVSFIKTKRSFCREWEWGGPVLQKYRVWLTQWLDDDWCADVPGEPGDPNKYPDPKPGEPGCCLGTGLGATPLIAAMRAVVAASKVKAAA